MMNYQTSQRPPRRPNGFPAAGPLMADRKGYGQSIEVAPDWQLGANVNWTRIIFLRSSQSERRVADHGLASSPGVIQGVTDLNHHAGRHPREAQVNDRPVPAPQVRAVTCRRLFPEPGQECIVAWEHASGMLARRLAHPERLQKSHRLRCYAQVYEATGPHRIEELAAAIFGDAALAATLHPLTDVLAARLGLTLTPLQAIRPRQRRPDPGAVLAGDRLVRVSAAGDPTADGAPGQTIPPGAGRPAAITRPTGQRTTIPECYLSPWEFRRSRREAIYDMQVLAHAGWLRRLWRRLRGSRLSHAELLRWEIMLSDKPIDEQLWGVRPPMAALTHPRVRDWAQETLATAGYNPLCMLAEWEIFWRRKT
jgi:hypothetical protein